MQDDPVLTEQSVEAASVSVELLGVVVPQPVVLDGDLEVRPRQIETGHELPIALDHELRHGRRHPGEHYPHAEPGLWDRLRARVGQLSHARHPLPTPVADPCSGVRA
ncbi:hypothetical protein JNW90_34810 [Micromonospora sp. STR1s_5]|nr:hypothetical protein [Micromonospora sp. STR1s_5]